MAKLRRNRKPIVFMRQILICWMDPFSKNLKNIVNFLQFYKYLGIITGLRECDCRGKFNAGHIEIE